MQNKMFYYIIDCFSFREGAGEPMQLKGNYSEDC